MTNHTAQYRPIPICRCTESRLYASPYTARRSASDANPDVSPGLAFVLGLIPGVGAIYNGQYAKGLIHVIIIGLMISILSNDAARGLEPLLGLLLAGFWVYMAFEAYHTAQQPPAGPGGRRILEPDPDARRRSKFPVAPVLLIALGVIFLLNNLDSSRLRRMLRYWPVLLIALGAYMLYRRMSADVDRTGDAAMNPEFCCARFAARCMLITLGVLLAIDQFGTVSFGRTWPVLLIVFGLFKLAERSGARQLS